MQLLNPIRRLFGASKPGNTSIQPYREPKAKVDVDDDAFLGWQLNANGKVYPIKQGSGWYGSGAGYGEGAFTETAIGAGVALTQSVFGWAAAYSVSTWVYRCIELRKQSVNRMPWYIYSKRTGKRIDNHPLAIALNRRTAQHPFKKLEQSQLLFGETFFEPMKNEYGFYSDLRWLNNLGMAVIIGAGHIQGYTYTAMQGGRAESFEYDDIAFMKTDNPFNDLRGMSPTEVILDEIAIDKDVARVVRSYYANDTRVGLLLIPKHNLNPADNERFMEIWKAQNQGVNKAGKPVLMPYDMSVERVQNPMTLDDMSLRESTRREIAAGYGVPLSMAGGWDDAKYQSLPEQRKSFYEETIIPECENIADFINQDVIEYYDDKIGRCGFKFDFSVVLALTEDAQRKGDMYSQRLTSGGITRAEYRQALGHTSKPEDEVYYIPAGVTIVPANEAVLVTPQTNQVQETPPGTPDDPSAVPPPTAPPGPDKPPSPTLPGNVFNARPSNVTPDVTPRQQPGPEAKRPQGPPPGKSAQGSVEDELRAWEKKALNTNPVKASSFVASQTPPDLQEVIRAALKAMGKDAPPQAVKTLFKVARAKWDESKHPRADNGRFGEGSGGSSDSSGNSEGTSESDSSPAAPETTAIDFGEGGVSADDYATQTSDELKGKLSTDEKDALVSYSGKADINGTLRYDLEPHAKEAAQIKAMDTAISKSPLKQRTTLYRGFDTRDLGKLEIGTTITDKGYTSTTISKKVATDFLPYETSALMVIDAPKGTNAASMRSIGEFKYRNQNEMLLGRGSKFKIIGVSTETINGKTRQVYRASIG